MPADASNASACRPSFRLIGVRGNYVRKATENRADERTRTAGLVSLRVIIQALQGFAVRLLSTAHLHVCRFEKSL
jgi:hypothetical protein